jgi:hypothetical protein
MSNRLTTHPSPHLILLYTGHHTTVCVLILMYMSPSYCCMCLLSTLQLSSYCYMCPPQQQQQQHCLACPAASEFTCFTSAKVQKLTQDLFAAEPQAPATAYLSFKSMHSYALQETLTEEAARGGAFFFLFSLKLPPHRSQGQGPTPWKKKKKSCGQQRQRWQSSPRASALLLRLPSRP